MERSDCIPVYGSTNKGGVVERSDCIPVYGSTTKGDVVKRSDCIFVHGSTTKGDVVKRSDCILVYGSTTKGDVVKRSDRILVYGSVPREYYQQCNLAITVCMYQVILLRHTKNIMYESMYSDICMYVQERELLSRMGGLLGCDFDVRVHPHSIKSSFCNSEEFDIYLARRSLQRYVIAYSYKVILEYAYAYGCMLVHTEYHQATSCSTYLCVYRS